MPYANYVDRQITYTIAGFDFLNGVEVLRGERFIEAQTAPIWGLVGAGILVLAAGLYFKVSKRIFGLLTMLGGALNVAGAILFMYNVNAIMEKSSIGCLSYIPVW